MVSGRKIKGFENNSFIATWLKTILAQSLSLTWDLTDYSLGLMSCYCPNLDQWISLKDSNLYICLLMNKW